MGRRAVAVVMGTFLVVGAAACGSDGDGGDPLARAELRVETATSDLATAEADLAAAREDFCADAEVMLEAIDRYGSAFSDAATTVGDVTSNGADLQDPRSAVVDSGFAAVDAGSAVEDATALLAEAEAELASLQSGEEVTPSTTSTTLVPPASVTRVQEAADDLTSAFEGVDQSTPLTEASAEVNAAGFALEVAWLRLFADAGCLDDEQLAQATATVAGYTAALQTDLTTAGYYTDEVDGIYGPATVAAVEDLQEAAGIPVTGFVDEATAAALQAALVAEGGAAAAEEVATTAAVQAALTLVGYWTGPADGKWTPELTEAVKELQTDLEVPVTGAFDATTLAALQEAIAEATTPASTTTTTAAETTSTTAAP